MTDIEARARAYADSRVPKPSEMEITETYYATWEEACEDYLAGARAIVAACGKIGELGK